ncbi:phosphatase PAP2 family protein [Kitasatospora sp. NPDC086009]|uniref:phosphatase PAP2 family protein n=1 Tax=unclassified Kitasatospora TaxID=2633591 RepID=UPI0037CA3922
MAHRVTGRRRPAVLAGSWAAFAVLAAVLAAHDWAPFPFERTGVDWSVAHRPPVAETVALAVTSLGTGVAPYLLVLAAGLVTLRASPAARSRRATAGTVLAPVLCLAAGQLLRQGLMHAFGRPRPPRTDWAFTASGFAFPSGHAFTSALCAGLLALAVARAHPRAARAAVVTAALFAGSIGLSRIYLGVHWPLDVLGAWLLAAGCLAAASIVPRPPTRSRAPAPEVP